MAKVLFTRFYLIFGLLLSGVVLSTAPLTAHAKHLLVFGDSLSAAYGMEWEAGWAQLLQQHWQDEGKHNLTNASVSGETTLGGLDRLPLSLEEFKPDVVLIELGANDGLRGAPISSIRANLQKMIELAQASNTQVILAGISLPPSYGPRYIDQFRQMFRDLAAQNEVLYTDLYLEEALSMTDAIQEDGLHPTEVVQPLIRDALLEFFKDHALFD